MTESNAIPSQGAAKLRRTPSQARRSQVEAGGALEAQRLAVWDVRILGWDRCCDLVTPVTLLREARIVTFPLFLERWLRWGTPAHPRMPETAEPNAVAEAEAVAAFAAWVTASISADSNRASEGVAGTALDDREVTHAADLPEETLPVLPPSKPGDAPIAVNAAASDSDREALSLLKSMLFGTQIEELTAALTAQQMRLERIEVRVSDPSELDLLHRELSALQKELSDRAELEGLQSQLSDLADQQGAIPKQIADLRDRLADIDRRLQEPEELIALVLPVFAELLHREIDEARSQFTSTIAPVIHEIIERKVAQDLSAMSAAISPVLPQALAQQVEDRPGEVGKAISPEIEAAISLQVRENANAMVDALYPIIGNTIAKYMAEAIRAINEKLEKALSPEGIARKIRAKLQGVSEAELLLKEALPYRVRAAFLIHKDSGLAIAEAQPEGEAALETDMVAGMLTAIRSFANDCIARTGTLSELDRINYGTSEILLEVAGHCYLAVAVDGEVPAPMARTMRRVLEGIVRHHDRTIRNFDGDRAAVPQDVTKRLERLVCSSGAGTTARSRPPLLLVVAIALLAAVAIPWGVGRHRQAVAQRLASQVASAWSEAPELAVYRLEVRMREDRLHLEGRLPNAYLRSRAETIARQAVPELAAAGRLIDDIVTANVPADPIAAAAELQRVTAIWNQNAGVRITTRYDRGEARIEGVIADPTDAARIANAIAAIPGVAKVTLATVAAPPIVPVQLFFRIGVAEIEPQDRGKLAQVKAFLDRHPNLGLAIVGYSDGTGDASFNARLARRRAEGVRDRLLALGISRARLYVKAKPYPTIRASQPQWVNRRVEFEAVVWR